LLRSYRYGLIIGVLALVMVGLTARWSLAQVPKTLVAQAQPAATGTLFENVQIFDGTSEQLSGPANVMVVGNKIQRISNEAFEPPADIGVTRINGDGKVLMPGLIDAHVHLYMATTSIESVLDPNADPAALEQNAQQTATDTLMRGFTSVRDLAGPVFNVKQAVDAGDVVGPRIYPSGAMISQTSGHGDYRSPADLPRAPYTQLSHPEIAGGSAISDGVPQVLRAVREQLMKGATQIKLAAGGGVASNFDPLDVSQYTEAELRAAVEAAADWNTYVTVHAYTPRAIQKAIRAGVKCIDHGQLMDEATAKVHRSRRSFALKVSGDSMVDAGIYEGDIVIIEPRLPNPNDVVAALIDGETTLKRFIQSGNKAPYLKAENQKYPEFHPVSLHRAVEWAAPGGRRRWAGRAALRGGHGERSHPGVRARRHPSPGCGQLGAA